MYPHPAGTQAHDGPSQVSAEMEEFCRVVTSWGSLVHVNFETEGEVPKSSDLNLDSPVIAAFYLAPLDEGVYFAPRCFMNTSTAMDEQVIDDVLEACSHAITRMAGLLNFTRSGS